MTNYPNQSQTLERPIESLASPVGITLDRFISQHQNHFQYATGELSQLLRDIALAGKIINREINRAGLIDITGRAGVENVQGEHQQKLDVVANIRFIRALKNGGEVCAIISEEDEGIIQTNNLNGRYVVAIDPLDGSSNIDVNVSIGTIFSIYRRITPVGTEPNLTDFLQGGRQQVAAGYILYGSSTIFVYTTGKGVNGFTFDLSVGEFILSHNQIITPKTGNIFSCNDGNIDDYPENVIRFLETCKRKKLSGRYIGSLVADFHRNMIKGGIYLYPKTHSAPQGKLRLLYECFPIAMVIEQAGGQASNGEVNTLDIRPDSIHQRSPFYVGSTELVNMLF